MHQHCSFNTILLWNTHLGAGCQLQLQYAIQIRVRVKAHRARKPAFSGILGLKKACQGNMAQQQNCSFNTFLKWDTHSARRSENQVQDTIQISVMDRVRVQRAKKPMDAGIPDLQKACQEEHGTAPTSLLHNLSHAGNPFSCRMSALAPKRHEKKG